MQLSAIKGFKDSLNICATTWWELIDVKHVLLHLETFSSEGNQIVTMRFFIWRTDLSIIVIITVADYTDVHVTLSTALFKLEK